MVTLTAEQADRAVRAARSAGWWIGHAWVCFRLLYPAVAILLLVAYAGLRGA